MAMHSSSHAQTQNKPTLIIAAIASRCYVAAAVSAGFDVVAIDCFVDVDTKRLAISTYQVPLLHGGLDGQSVLAAIGKININTVAGFCYGAGFEMQATLLTDINRKVAVIGNVESVVENCKAPDYFFNVCDAHQIPHPESRLHLTSLADGWLEKTVGGSSGAHIKRLQTLERVKHGDVYFQRYQQGKTISCLFLANAEQVQVVGFNEQWLDGSDQSPFRYGGAVSHAEISGLAEKRLLSYIEKLVKELELVGLNSCDAICDGDDVYVLEINPRLSATVDLYKTEYPDLLSRHVKACQHGELDDLGSIDGEPRHVAHQVIYAEAEITVPENVSWHTWVADVPEDGVQFKVGMPICTITAEASTVTEAKTLVQDRRTIMQKHFFNEWL